jgi:hypothetical protein
LMTNQNQHVSPAKFDPKDFLGISEGDRLATQDRPLLKQLPLHRRQPLGQEQSQK